MDNFFVCLTCKTYHNAGDRWCWWNLERPGVVRNGEPVDVEAVFRNQEYWNGAALAEEHMQSQRHDLPKIKRFLEKHRAHDVLFYSGSSDFLRYDETFFDWMDEEESEFADLSPRYWVERLGFTTWQQVIECMTERSGGLAETWWYRDLSREAAKWKFEKLVPQKKADNANSATVPEQ